MSASKSWEDVYRVQTARIAELEKQLAAVEAQRDALREDNERLKKRAYLTVSLCCFEGKEEADFSYENAYGEKVAFTLKMPKKIMNDVAKVIGPCVYYEAAIDAAKGGGQ